MSSQVTVKSIHNDEKIKSSDGKDTPDSSEIIKEMVRKQSGVKSDEKLTENAHISFTREQFKTAAKQKIKTEPLTSGGGTWSEELDMNLENTVRGIVSKLAWSKHFCAAKKARTRTGR